MLGKIHQTKGWNNTPRSLALCGRARGTHGSRKDAKQLDPHAIVTPLHLPGEEKGSGDELGKHAQFAFCELHRVHEKTLEGLVLSVRVVLSEAVLVLREAVLVLEPTAINIATMNDKSWLIEVTGFRVRVPLH